MDITMTRDKRGRSRDQKSSEDGPVHAKRCNERKPCWFIASEEEELKPDTPLEPVRHTRVALGQ